MTDVEKLKKHQMLEARFSFLANMAYNIIQCYGNIHNCPFEMRREYVQIGVEQQWIQQQQKKLDCELSD